VDDIKKGILTNMLAQKKHCIQGKSTVLVWLENIALWTGLVKHL
jgi:hypothetical protein